jgi:hypothetical protein
MQKITLMEKRTLSEKIASVLQTELENYGNVVAGDGNILITLSPEDFQQRLGPIFIQTTQIIDQYFPERDEDIRIFFQDRNGRQQNVFRIWHSAAA